MMMMMMMENPAKKPEFFFVVCVQKLDLEQSMKSEVEAMDETRKTALCNVCLH